MTRPDALTVVAAGIAVAAGYKAVRRRREIATLIEVWRLPTEPPDPRSSDPAATARYLATHRSHP